MQTISRTQALRNADIFIFLVTKLSQISLVLRPEEEEKRSGFSRLQLCLIAVKFHSLHTPAIYLRTFMMSNFDTKRYTVRRFIVAAYYGIQRTCLLMCTQ